MRESEEGGGIPRRYTYSKERHKKGKISKNKRGGE